MLQHLLEAVMWSKQISFSGNWEDTKENICYETHISEWAAWLNMIYTVIYCNDLYFKRWRFWRKKEESPTF